MKLDRKEFIQMTLAMAGVGFGLSHITGCGGSDAPPPGGGAGTGGGAAGTSGGNANACDANPPNETIAANHGHVLTVSQGDVTAAASKTYSIKGTSTHDHMVTVSPGNFGTLKSGGTVQLTSTNGAGHTHGITIVCA